MKVHRAGGVWDVHLVEGQKWSAITTDVISNSSEASRNEGKSHVNELNLNLPLPPIGKYLRSYASLNHPPKIIVSPANVTLPTHLHTLYNISPRY